MLDVLTHTLAQGAYPAPMAGVTLYHYLFVSAAMFATVIFTGATIIYAF